MVQVVSWDVLGVIFKGIAQQWNTAAPPYFISGALAINLYVPQGLKIVGL